MFRNEFLFIEKDSLKWTKPNARRLAKIYRMSVWRMHFTTFDRVKTLSHNGYKKSWIGISEFQYYYLANGIYFSHFRIRLWSSCKSWFDFMESYAPLHMITLLGMFWILFFSPICKHNIVFCKKCDFFLSHFAKGMFWMNSTQNKIMIRYSC